MSYLRVIPRDLFNEANLLKCYGKLWIELEGHETTAQLGDQEAYDTFDIDQNPDDGSLTVSNIPLYIHGKQWFLYRPLNSRSAWPLRVTDTDDPDVDLLVFDDAGNLSEEFKNLMREGAQG